ncbi:MAG: hypothetical protein ACYSW7_11940 [Planctomycetota bacterium]|jgi:hypothetical protein
MLRNNAGGSPFLDFTVADAPLLDSIQGYLQAVGEPSEPNICSVYCWLGEATGEELKGGKVKATLFSAVDTTIDGTKLVVGVPAETHTESNGYFSIGVIPNAVVDDSSHYRFEIWGDDEGYWQADVYVPDSNTVNLIDLLRSFRR